MTSTRKNSQDFDFSFKILVLGDIGVGKTKLTERFCEGYFRPAYVSTLGIDFSRKTIDVDNVKVKLQIWDTAGQERYRTLTRSFYRGALGVILMYDVTLLTSFRNLMEWLENVREYSISPDIPVVLVGTKHDLESSRTVEARSANDFANEHDLPHFTVSAKTGENVEAVFLKLCRLMLQEKYKRRQSVSNALLTIKPIKEERKCPSCQI